MLKSISFHKFGINIRYPYFSDCFLFTVYAIKKGTKKVVAIPQIYPVFEQKRRKIFRRDIPRAKHSKSRSRREIPICRQWTRFAVGGRRSKTERKGEKNLSSPCPANLASLSGRIYTRRHRGRAVSIFLRDSRRAASRAVHRRRWPRSPSPPHSVTLELSVEGHTACVHNRDETRGVYICAHARVCGARNREREREKESK